MDEAPLFNKSVEGLAEYGETPHVTMPPQAWVVPQGRVSDGNWPASRFIERVTILVGVRNVKDPNGEAALVELEPAINAVERAYAGWLPPGEWDGPLRFRGDNLFDMDKNQNLIWYLNYEVHGLMRPDFNNEVTC